MDSYRYFEECKNHKYQNDRKRAFSILSLFLMTGLAIIIFVNQDNPQPRERDYSYVGSFFAFSIWISIAIQAFLDKFRKLLQGRSYQKND